MLMCVSFLPSVRCRRCSRVRHPNEFVAGGPITGYCLRCYEWHHKALAMLAGEPPPGCQECGVSFQTLTGQTSGEVKMYLHPRDGIYQILCRVCSDVYERKRSDLYRDTPHGRANNL